VPHPKFPKTLWTFGSIAQVRVPETPERVVACLVGANKRVNEPQMLQRRVKMPAKVAGCRIRTDAKRGAVLQLAPDPCSTPRTRLAMEIVRCFHFKRFGCPSERNAQRLVQNGSAIISELVNAHFMCVIWHI
jgi:hypothetical protein